LTIGFTSSSQFFDPKTGLMTREGQNLIQFMVNAVNGSGAVLTTDSEQTLTGKTMDGDSNTFTDIPTSALKTVTGEISRVVTGAAGASGTVAAWDANGDLVEGETQASLLTIAAAQGTYLPLDGSVAMVGPVKLMSYTVAGVPSAASYTGGIIYVSDETGGATLAFSDSTNWRRVQDRAIIS
jgi:hypothetical protein